MKFLFVLSEYLPDSGGGIISYYRELLPGLVRAGHEVDVLVARADRLDLPERQIDGVRVRYLSSGSVKRMGDGFERFKSEFPTLHTFLPVAWAAYETAGKGEGYDLVETTDWQLLFAPWVVSRVAPPVTVALHGSCGQVEWFEKSAVHQLDGDLVRLIEQASIKAAPGAYANSRLNARFWEDQSGRAIGVLPPIFNQAGPIDFDQEPESTGVVVGRLQGWKGPQIICEALRLAPKASARWIGKDMPHFTTGEMTSQWLQRTYPDVFGTRLLSVPPMSHEAVLKDIARAKFLCVPSTWDVFNLTALEGMGTGTPVICSRKAGAEMLIRHGENGFLFDPDHPAQLAECLNEVAAMDQQERSKMARNAAETLRQFLNPESLLQDRMDFYKKVAGQKSKGAGSENWLEAAVSPATAGASRDHILQTFPCKQLTGAAAASFMLGIRRRFNGRPAK